ncbi:Protein of unknown function [Gryllus bimaculatus]|nr:Protein of unknown function [Gryllus bimaculatus]
MVLTIIAELNTATYSASWRAIDSLTRRMEDLENAMVELNTAVRHTQTLHWATTQAFVDIQRVSPSNLAATTMSPDVLIAHSASSSDSDLSWHSATSLRSGNNTLTSFQPLQSASSSPSIHSDPSSLPDYSALFLHSGPSSFPGPSAISLQSVVSHPDTTPLYVHRAPSSYPDTSLLHDPSSCPDTSSMSLCRDLSFSQDTSLMSMQRDQSSYLDVSATSSHSRHSATSLSREMCSRTDTNGPFSPREPRPYPRPSAPASPSGSDTPTNLSVLVTHLAPTISSVTQSDVLSPLSVNAEKLETPTISYDVSSAATLPIACTSTVAETFSTITSTVDPTSAAPSPPPTSSAPSPPPTSSAPSRL